MPQSVSYQVRITMRSGRIYHTNSLTTLASDDRKVPDLFDALTEHVFRDYAQAKAEGTLFDVRSVERTAGITGLNPAEVESVEVIIVSVLPATVAQTEDVKDELDYDQRLAERFPDTVLPPTDVPTGGSGLQADQVADGVAGMELAPDTIVDDPAQPQAVLLDDLHDGPEPLITD